MYFRHSDNAFSVSSRKTQPAERTNGKKPAGSACFFRFSFARTLSVACIEVATASGVRVSRLLAGAILLDAATLETLISTGGSGHVAPATSHTSRYTIRKDFHRYKKGKILILLQVTIGALFIYLDWRREWHMNLPPKSIGNRLFRIS